MNITVPIEERFARTPDGIIWSQTTLDYPFWSRYLEVFDQVRVVARMCDVSKVQPEWKQASGEGVTFFALPYYVGPAQYALKAWQVWRTVRAAMATATSEAVILRAPGPVSSLVHGCLRRDGHPFGVEVLSDPYGVFAPGAVRHPLRPFFRWWFYRGLRRQCTEARAVAYLTEEVLQRRYPPAKDALATYYADVELRDEAFVGSPRPVRSSPSTLKIVTVGSLEHLYKAPDVLIGAVSMCIAEGLDINLTFIGDGRHRAELEAHTNALGLSERIRFLGRVPAGEGVRAQLDRADLFVLPSRSDALPRAMTEAMARGLPCIGSTADGIPELLPSEDMVPPGDARALAQKIYEVASDPERMARMSARNVEKAKEYREEILREQRVSFYEYLRKETEAWLKI